MKDQIMFPIIETMIPIINDAIQNLAPLSGWNLHRRLSLAKSILSCISIPLRTASDQASITEPFRVESPTESISRRLALLSK